MTGNARHEKHPPRLYVKRWLKLMMYGVCLIPIVVMIVSVLREANSPTGNMPVAVISSILVTVPVGWLFARRYSLCSIIVSEEGVAQSFTPPRNSLRKHVHLRWVGRKGNYPCGARGSPSAASLAARLRQALRAK